MMCQPECKKVVTIYSGIAYCGCISNYFFEILRRRVIGFLAITHLKKSILRLNLACIDFEDSNQKQFGEFAITTFTNQDVAVYHDVLVNLVNT
jgi:hypothetical protein